MRPLQIMKKKHPWHGLYPIKVRITIPNQPNPNPNPNPNLSRCEIETLIRPNRFDHPNRYQGAY